jgi:hypothetical protein
VTLDSVSDEARSKDHVAADAYARRLGAEWARIFGRPVHWATETSPRPATWTGYEQMRHASIRAPWSRS